MRAGLLSQPEVIQRVNQRFVCTTLSRAELLKFVDSGDAMARELSGQWSTPLILAFLSPEGRFITKLTSLEDLNEIHPDTTRRPEAPQRHALDSAENNARVFLKHVDKHFPDQPAP